MIRINLFFLYTELSIVTINLDIPIFHRLVLIFHTSQKCSNSGYMGKRTGKAFSLSHCQMSLDSDLNAAKNIALSES
ncbi:MAG: transposase [Candidatus Lokiarchaeota archaeon]|nr:transposase [Candidatus Lokiarchaeota archaeon]